MRGAAARTPPSAQWAVLLTATDGNSPGSGSDGDRGLICNVVCDEGNSEDERTDDHDYQD